MAKQMKNGKAKQPNGGELTVSVQIDAKPDTPFYYVNYLGVNHTPYDFTISALKLPFQLTREQKEYAKRNEPVPMEPTLQLVIPTHLIKGLIKALSIQCQMYETKFGEIPSEEDKSNGRE